ncbi:MAG: putative DNA binding domain-containing protein [Burkholderiales bacterium]|nr:putative DNA binding domain-containing protein [Burkholderiales bacterium]
MRLADEELERMLADTESDRCERKETFRGESPTMVREAVCAFANDLPGHGRPGIVFVGAHDNGALTGLPITDELLRSLADVKTDGNILPPPSLSVEKRALGGIDVAVITVQPSDSPPVRFKGRIWIRIGPRRGIATAQDERVLNERRRHLDRPFDVRKVAGAALADLDLRRFTDEYLGHVVATDVLAANERSSEQQLAATKMIASVDDPVPTVLGILVLCHQPRNFLPGAYLQFLRIAGKALSDPIVDESAIEGPLVDVLRRIDDKVAAHNRTSIDLSSEPRERRIPTYPEVALQQLVRNAVMHRSYESTNAPVRITWYDDRVEISSPGGPFGIVGKANFGQAGVADYRNPNLAEALRALGFVQRFGVGIATARRELERNGNPEPEFQVTDSFVNAIVRARA